MGFGKDGRGVIIREKRQQALGTLAANIAIFIGTKVPIADDFRMLKYVMKAYVEGLTAGEGLGLALYLCDGDLTLSEIASCITGTAPVDGNDIVAANIAERPVFEVSSAGRSSTGADTQIRFMNETGGPIIIGKPRWSFANTRSWNWVLFNESTSALTTGATVRIVVKDYGVWVD